MEILDKCILCPRECKVNRNAGELGRCRAGALPKIALANLHYYEEPCISGKNGSGTVFFTGCNLSCKFCQNYKVSQEFSGNELSVESLAEEFLRLQSEGAHNINLVTAFAYVPMIVTALDVAKTKGLKLPIVYNSSGYEAIETLKMLEGYVDVYLPDFKYAYNDLAKNLSGVDNYFEIVQTAIKEMKRQVGQPIFDEAGMIERGLIVRHLVLPNHLQNTKKVLKWIKEHLGKDTYVSLMAQYFPTYKAMETDDINRKLTEEEYEEIENYFYSLSLKNGYMQEIEEDETRYVPNF